MSFCPNCKHEYNGELKVCPNCNTELTDGSDGLFLAGKPTLLTEVFDRTECDLICGILEEQGIQTRIKYKGADLHLSLYMGNNSNNESIGIYVPENAVKKAAKILDSAFPADADAEIPLEPEDIVIEKKSVNKKRAIVWLLIFCAVGIPIIIYSVFFFKNMFSKNDTGNKYKLYAADTDGKNKKVLSDGITSTITVTDDWVFFTNTNNGGKIHAFNISENKIKWISDNEDLRLIDVIDERVFFNNPPRGGEQFNFYAIDKDGENKILLDNVRT